MSFKSDDVVPSEIQSSLPFSPLSAENRTLLPKEKKDSTKFSLPNLPSRYVMPALFIGILLWGLLSQDGNVYFKEILEFGPNTEPFVLFGKKLFYYSENNFNHIALLMFYIIFFIFTLMAVVKDFALIPVLGVLAVLTVLE